MRRGRLVRGFIIEGAVYALVASTLGLVAGLGVGRAVVEVTARSPASPSRTAGSDLVYTVTPTSLINGFAAGFLIGFLTVALTSIRISRISIIAAIRDLPPEAGRPLKWRWVLASTLAAPLGPPRWSPSPAARASAPTCTAALAAVALCPLLVRLLPRAGRAIPGVAGRARLGAGRQHGPAQGVRRRLHRPLHRPGRGADLLGGAAVSQNQELLLRLVRQRLPPGGVRPGGQAGQVPGGRRFRTGATLIMYGLVVFSPWS